MPESEILLVRHSVIYNDGHIGTHVKQLGKDYLKINMSLSGKMRPKALIGNHSRRINPGKKSGPEKPKAVECHQIAFLRPVGAKLYRLCFSLVVTCLVKTGVIMD